MCVCLCVCVDKREKDESYSEGQNYSAGKRSSKKGKEKGTMEVLCYLSLDEYLSHFYLSFSTYTYIHIHAGEVMKILFSIQKHRNP